MLLLEANVKYTVNTIVCFFGALEHCESQFMLAKKSSVRPCIYLAIYYNVLLNKFRLL